MEGYELVESALQKRVIDACKANTFEALDVVVKEVVDYLPLSEKLLDLINESLKALNLPVVEIYYQSGIPMFYKKFVNVDLGSGLFTGVPVKHSKKIDYISSITDALDGTTGLLSTPAIDYIAGLCVRKYIEYVMPLPVTDPADNTSNCCFKSIYGLQKSNYTGPIKASHKGSYVRSAEVVHNALKPIWQKFMKEYLIPTFPTIGKEEQYNINYEAVLKQFQLSYCPLTVKNGKVELLNNPGLYVNDPYKQNEKANMHMCYTKNKVFFCTTGPIQNHKQLWLKYSNIDSVDFFAKAEEKETARTRTAQTRRKGTDSARPC